MNNPFLIRMSTPIGEALEIPIHDFGPSDQMPQLALVSGIHGNELNGIFVLARLADQLRKRQERKNGNPVFKKRLLIIPAVNVLGLHVRTRNWPVDRTDINRMFPGYNAGETTQRLAAAVFDLTRPAAVRVDIHASNLEFEELPQTRLYGSTPEERQIGEFLGLPAVIECPVNKVSTATLLHAWKQQGGHNLVIQAGAAGNLQKEHCDRLLNALLKLMGHLGILSDPLSFEQEDNDDHEDSRYFPLHRTVSLISKKAGLFVPRVHVGQHLDKGAHVGNVYDGFDGRIRSRVKAPRAGFLTGLRCQPLIYEGDLLARLQADSDVEEGADTYLIGQGQ